MDPRELLWADTAVHHRRIEKSAVGLLAVGRVVSAARAAIPGADEFIRLHEWVTRLDPDHFTQIWRDPTAYYWVRRAIHFLASRRGEPLGTVERDYLADVGATSPAVALGIHLRDFKRFAIAAAVLSGSDVSFAEPYDVALPLSIPGTSLVLLGSTRAVIRGLTNGALAVLDPERLLPVSPSTHQEQGGLRLEAYPSIAVGAAHVRLNPATFNLPGIGFPIAWTRSPPSFQSRHQPLATEALSTIRRLQPTTFEHLEAALHTIALKPDDGTFFNISASDLPGAFVCTVPSDPYALAAAFIHEFHHNTFFGIEEAGAFFSAGAEDQIEGEDHYSPWVATPRPAHGILHALYVFLPVFRFWTALLRGDVVDGPPQAYARDQLARLPIQLRIAVNQLRRHARFTPFGSLLFEEMAKDVSEAEATARAMGATVATAAMGISPSGALRPLRRDGRTVSVGESLLEHLTNGDARGECAEEKAVLARTII